ncbi:AAA family ATPase [Brevibacterium luteolum]|uniref:AAA family ATPase n=1 Tax=Brevibacterium luteolum TaxID=199591 RepID=UPI00223AB6B4|nr:ATP-binding protein [Brevibacterium luteolum]MCT1873529.1 ATP-binding protein [Brevibacterium luteolum]MCT1889426.1 ATP-binding protein [Brevibacterium luteolum]MCT1893734.1 ATP-binding protein [Brevibacterium luteolum]MCT1923171.1 ATP-binding protein [Brevibacterium luteolum]
MNDIPRTAQPAVSSSTSLPVTPTEVQDFARRFSAFVDAMNDSAAAGAPDAASFGQILTDHLGNPAEDFEAVTKRFPVWRYADLDIAVEAVLGSDRSVHGINTDEDSYDFTELIANRYDNFRPGAVQYDSVPVGPDTHRRVAAEAVSLFTRGGVPMALLQHRSGDYGQPVSHVSVLSADHAAADALLTEIAETMNARSALRGQVVTFGGGAFDETAQPVQFHPRPHIEADQVILPADSLSRIRRHVLGISEMAPQLQAAGQHLKRGVLLYGPPGTGKTHTVRYLTGLSAGVTVIMLAGESLGAISLAAETARALQPALVVLEDCDLIAESRDYSEGTRPLLFDVLDALDGLAGDADVAFILTTNRAEALEEALVQRPGRIDLAVEIPLPDTSARQDLFELYAQQLDFSPETLTAAAERTDGVTASFVKEAVRRAVVLATLDGRSVADEDLLAAVDELRSDAERLTASLLASGGDAADFEADSDWADDEPGDEFDV